MCLAESRCDYLIPIAVNPPLLAIRASRNIQLFHHSPQAFVERFYGIKAGLLATLAQSEGETLEDSLLADQSVDEYSTTIDSRATQAGAIAAAVTGANSNPLVGMCCGSLSLISSDLTRLVGLFLNAPGMNR